MNVKRILAIILLIVMLIGTFSSCAGNQQQGEKGDKGDQGIQGEKGEDGTDGKDGKTPLFKVENGEIFVSYNDGASWDCLGNVSGEDGKDGENGKDGITPKIRINPSTGMWEVSYDNGTTWCSMDVQAPTTDSEAEQARIALIQYLIANGGKLPEYMLYDADGRWVALKNGTVAGVYESKDGAVKALCDNPDTSENEALSYTSVRIVDTDLYMCHPYLNNLTYVAFGDSITQGIDGNSVSGADRQMANPYPELVGQALGFSRVINKGKSAATLCSCSRPDGTQIICDYSGEADIISVMLGVNDYQEAAQCKLGNKDSTIGENSVYGRLKLIAKTLTTKYPDALIFFMTPFQYAKNGANFGEINRGENFNPPSGFNLPDVVQAVKYVAELYNIPVLDMYALGRYELEMYDNTLNDGIHPSQQHHVNYTAPLISEFIINHYDSKGNYTPENDNIYFTPGTHVINYKNAVLSEGYVTIANNTVKINSSKTHKYFTVSAKGIDTITVTPGGDGPNNNLCYIVYVDNQGGATSYAPIKSGESTTIRLGGTATGTIYFNYYTDNPSVYVSEATITVVSNNQ